MHNGKQMKILLIGNKGQLGWELHRTLYPLGQVTAIDYPEFDLLKPTDIVTMIKAGKPDFVVNAAAYTDVDRAESEKALAMKVNGEAPGTIAEACRQTHSVFIHYSTDYVFNGEKGSPYFETDIPDPINAYGASKLAGEQAISAIGGSSLVLRTSWVYSLRKGGFVNKVLDWSRKQTVIRIVDDQTGSPTWARMLAQTTALLISIYRDDPYVRLGEHAGVYHLAGDGCVNRYEWARSILENVSTEPGFTVNQLEPAKSNEFPTPARRPTYSGLDCMKFEQHFGMRLPAWQETLRLALNQNEMNLPVRV
jgi:dTDP-4-dehydrorhamnose reductase